VLPFFVILLVGAWGSGGVAKSSPNGVKSDEGWKCSIGKIQWMGGYAQLATWLAGYFPYIYIRRGFATKGGSYAYHGNRWIVWFPVPPGADQSKKQINTV
jgi:hypothetical protein